MIKKDLKSFIVRVPKNLWLTLKDMSIEEERSMNAIVIDSLVQYEKNNYDIVDS